jgi:perosamine synthetase
MRAPARIPVAWVDVRPEDVRAAVRVLESGRLRQGVVTAEFERAFAERVGAAHAVAVSSGTAALHLAYLALFAPGDEVIVPSFTFVATASMLLAVGAVPVFADVDPRTWTLSVEEAEARLTERTRGIAGVHLFGNACDVDGLSDLARRHGLVTVWDAAQALGTEYRGRDVGGYPSAVCYSFYPTKHITTGEGGMVVTDDGELAERLRLSRSQGAAEKYVHVTLGFNYRMTDVQAAVGLEQLQRLDSSLAARRANAGVLTDGLAGARGITTPWSLPEGRHSFHQYAIVLDDRAPVGRDGFVEALACRGIETAVHYPRPLHRQPLFEGTSGTLPVSEQLSDRIVSIPVHPGMTPDDLESVVTAARDAL